MSDESDSAYATTNAIGTPDPYAQSEPAVGGEFRMDVLLIGLVVVGAIIVSNIWLRKRAERDDSE